MTKILRTHIKILMLIHTWGKRFFWLPKKYFRGFSSCQVYFSFTHTRVQCIFNLFLILYIFFPHFFHFSPRQRWYIFLLAAQMRWSKFHFYDAGAIHLLFCIFHIIYENFLHFLCIKFEYKKEKILIFVYFHYRCQLAHFFCSLIHSYPKRKIIIIMKFFLYVKKYLHPP
jgi:hypothetical protein